MLLQLLKALGSNKLSFVVQHISMAPIDIDLLLYQAQHDGEIKIDKEKNRITALKEAEPYYSPALAEKIVSIVREYDRQGANIPRNNLEQTVLDIVGGLYQPNGVIQRPGDFGYSTHDLVCTLYALEQGQVPDQPKLNRYEIEVPAVKNKRPYNKFVFYTELDHQEFGAKAVNAFIAQFDSKKVK